MDDFAGYRIEDEHPGRALRLKWHGRPPATWALWSPYLATLLLIAVWGALAFLLREQWQAIITQGLEGPSEAHLALVMVVFGSVFYAAFIIRGAYAGAMARGYWSELDWNVASGKFSATFVGVPLLGRRRVDIPLSQISGLHFDVGPEDAREMMIEMRVEFREDRPELRAPLIVQQLDVRVEALDLLFRLARIVGIGEFVVWQNNPVTFSVAALQPDHIDWIDDLDDEYEEDEEEAEEEEGGDDEENESDERGGLAGDQQAPARVEGRRLSIPPGDGYADYTKLTPNRGFKPSSPYASDFSLEKFAPTIAFHKIAVWKPGERIVVSRPAWTIAGCVFGPLFLGAVVGGIIAGFMPGVVDLTLYPLKVGRWIAFGLISLIASSAAFLYFWPKMRERSVEFDFGSRRMTWRHGMRVFECFFDDLSCFTLGPRRMTRIDSRQGRIVDLLPGGGAQLHVEFAGKSLPIIETDSIGGATAVEIAKLQPLADALAKSFNVACRTIDERNAGTWITSRQWSRERTSIVFALATLVAIAIGVRSYQHAAALNRLEEAKQAVVAAGGVMEFVERREVAPNYALKDVWRVEFPQGIDDAKLRSLVAHFANIPRLDLNLSRTAVTDASVVELGPLPHLVGLDLAGLQISNAGLDQFYRLYEVEAIDLSRTAIRDEGVSMCAMNDKLRVLKLADTRVSDMSMSNLRVRDKLLYLDVRGTAVTAAGVAELQGGVPGVSIQAAPPTP